MNPISSVRSHSVNVVISKDRQLCGQAAARVGAEAIREAIAKRGHASIIVATGASQFEMLDALVVEPGIDWHQVTAFHLDEYVGLPVTHPASFRKYLWERFHRRLPVPLGGLHYIVADSEPQQECQRLSGIIREQVIDVCFGGIGENAHLAFNDPPADFETDVPYLVVSLDEACRKQQLGEGWFPDLESVPAQAISMSVQQIMKSKTIIITAPDERKARAVRDSLEGDITRGIPSSILQRHPQTHFFLDPASASALKKQ